MQLRLASTPAGRPFCSIPLVAKNSLLLEEKLGQHFYDLKDHMIMNEHFPHYHCYKGRCNLQVSGFSGLQVSGLQVELIKVIDCG